MCLLLFLKLLKEGLSFKLFHLLIVSGTNDSSIKFKSAFGNGIVLSITCIIV